jgi:hypothetical protein
MASQRLVLAMLVRNEAGRYLRTVLESALPWVDAVAILDDASTDSTVLECQELLKGAESLIRIRTESGFDQEWAVRQELWGIAMSMRPDWVLVLDADEVLDIGAGPTIRAFTESPEVNWLAFPLYDMWSATHYRDDALWTAHNRHFCMATRVWPEVAYHWATSAQHCGRLPANALRGAGAFAEARILHMGWSRQVDREAKFLRYLKLDPTGVYGSMAQYESILDPTPHLVPLRPEPSE